MYRERNSGKAEPRQNFSDYLTADAGHTSVAIHDALTLLSLRVHNGSRSGLLLRTRTLARQRKGSPRSPH